MNTDRLMKILISKMERYETLPWMEGYTEHASFRPDGEPRGDIREQVIGKWLSIVAVLRWDGTTMDQTTDRLGGDPYTGIVRYDWIGLKETAPTEVSTPEEVDEWAEISLVYSQENTDVGLWGVHQGSWVKDMTEDGEVVIVDVKGRYRDENPQTLGERRTVQL